ncbi:YhbY family RNA-binding protein [candidate division KSB1 bacterium]|nr:YhbY family RNA-binding protein [candidate division KSB1 bacterium]RQW06941.1 MAG: YhbY family RNA-binding protein [candidate division KSB1 bacterium]
MKKLTGAQRRHLRGLANTMKPHVAIGKNGLSQAVIAAIDEALDDFELVKIRFLEFKEQKQQLSERIKDACHCEMVGMVGHVALFYREQADPEKRSIALP